VDAPSKAYESRKKQVLDGLRDAKDTSVLIYKEAGVVVDNAITWVNDHLLNSDDEGIIPKALQYGSDEYKIVLDSYIDNVIQYGTEDERTMYTRYRDKIIGIEEKFLILGDRGSWDDEGRIIEDIPWHNQRDNGLEKSYGIKGSYMCQSSVLANLFEGSGIEIPGSDTQPENRLLKILVDDAKKPASDAYKQQIAYYKTVVKEITGNDSNIIINHVDYRQTWNDNSTKEIINSGRPVAVGSKTTESGHVLTLIGYDKTGWIVNDSYGNKNLNYSKSKIDSYGYNGHNGSAVHYNYGQYDIQKKWRAYMKD
jgi:hypothetical protein